MAHNECLLLCACFAGLKTGRTGSTTEHDPGAHRHGLRRLWSTRDHSQFVALLFRHFQRFLGTPGTHTQVCSLIWTYATYLSLRTLELQPKLLRVIQERQFERLGGAATIHADVRVICATHRNLVEMVDKREFRADLFYRLSVFPIELPPLRERPEDIRLLVHHFAMDYAARMRKRITAISEKFMTALVHHSWPGNVRELQNLIERSVILSTGAMLSGSPPELNSTSKLSAPVTLEEADRSHILQTLQQTEGVVGGRDGAAARLGLPRTTLIAKMQRLGINREQSSALPVRPAA
jgi:hypothetical protein